MNLIEVIFLAIALGIDCLVVSFSQGLIFTEQRRENSMKLALTMGLFQGLMPIIGYVAAGKFYEMLVPYSKLIVFSIFCALGVHFILEAFSKEEDEQIQCIGLRCLVGLGVATSIDALISGTTLKLTDTNLFFACCVIGLFSILLSVLGFSIGKFVKHLPKRYLQILGGAILLLLAIKGLC